MNEQMIKDLFISKEELRTMLSKGVTPVLARSGQTVECCPG